MLHVWLEVHQSCYSMHSDTVHALDIAGRHMFLLVFDPCIPSLFDVSIPFRPFLRKTKNERDRGYIVQLGKPFSGARTGERLLWQPLCFLPQPPDQAKAHARARSPCTCPPQHSVCCGENTLCTFAPTATTPAFVPCISIHLLALCCEQPTCTRWE